MSQAGDLAEIGRQPFLQPFQQRGVADVRPLALALVFQVQPAQQADARLPLAQFRGPGQQLQALAPDQAEQRLAARRFVEAG
ncbi:hypothetical protein P4118_06130 [Pseudomonas aeruginosa]|nr:hypothetical protein [Pseudomonas aeruginosa]